MTDRRNRSNYRNYKHCVSLDAESSVRAEYTDVNHVEFDFVPQGEYTVTLHTKKRVAKNGIAYYDILSLDFYLPTTRQVAVYWDNVEKPKSFTLTTRPCYNIMESFE